MYNSVLSIRNTSLYGSQPSSVFFVPKSAWIAPEILVCMGPIPHLWFLNEKQRFCTRMTSLYEFQPSPVVLCMQNGDYWTRITNLYVFQASPVVLSMQYNVISTRITCLYGSLLQVSMGPILHLWFFDVKQRLLGQNYKSLWNPDLTCHFVHAKQRLLDQNYKSLWVPAHIWGFVHWKQRLLEQNYKSVWDPDLTCRFVHAVLRD